ncbi:MAG: hypothetical protein IKJ33_01960 [Clostridia bacterium]|nr:hypothetical protein [Clostridia bacterium]
MKINKVIDNIKCDSVLCFNTASFEIQANSYKGNQYLCSNCFKKYQKLFKEQNKSNEK